jgi:hypothetical protein
MGGVFDDLKKAATYQAVLAELVGTGLLTLAALLAGTPYAVALILAAGWSSTARPGRALGAGPADAAGRVRCV